MENGRLPKMRRFVRCQPQSILRRGLQIALCATAVSLAYPVSAYSYGHFYTQVSAPQFFLRNSNSEGLASYKNFGYGEAGDMPVAGDWDGDGDDTIGVFRPSNPNYHFRNSNSAGPADEIVWMGAVGDLPVIGDWDGDGDDTGGVYRPSNSVFLLKNVNTQDVADPIVQFGVPGDKPVVGDWDGDGHDTIGVYRPSEGRFYLRNSNTEGNANLIINYGASGDTPVAGDWNGDGVDTVGVYRRGGDTNWHLRNSNAPTGGTEFEFRFGDIGTPLPVTGDWNGDQKTTIGFYLPPNTDRWDHHELTYAFINGTNDIAGEGERQAVRSAMVTWTKRTGLTFNETPLQAAEIKFGWEAPWSNPERPFLPAGNLDWVHVRFPIDGTISFNDGEMWTAGTRSGTASPIDLTTVAAHAIGHVLGFEDSGNAGVMYLSYTGSSRTLSSTEATQAVARYGSHTTEERYFLRNANTYGIPDIVFDGTCPGARNIFTGDFDYYFDGYDTVGCLTDPCGICYAVSVFYTGRHPSSNSYFKDRSFSDDSNVTLFSGDWNGDNIDTFGWYYESENKFHLRNSFDQSESPLESTVGDRGDIPLAGDWDGDGKDSLGVYRPSNGVFYLRNKLGSGPVDYSIAYGNSGDVPVVGDWNNDNRDSIGVYRPSTGVWYLSNTLNSNPPSYVFPYGNVDTLVPIVGDWDANGTDTPGFAQD